MKAGVLWGASLGAVAGYLAAALLPFLPVLRFLPGRSRWSFAASSDEAVISWYGWLLYAAAGALFGMAGGRFVKRPVWPLLFWAAALSLLLLSIHEQGWFSR